MGVVMYPSMFACAWLKPMWYAARFERACDLVHMLGLLTRHGLNFADSASTGENHIEKNFLTYLLRPAVVIISGLSLCLLYTSPSPRDKRQSRMPSSA